VDKHLPYAVEVLRDLGVSVPMITTEITAADAMARRVLNTAAELGVTHFRLGYWHYRDEPVRQVLARIRPQVRAIAELAGSIGIVAGWHNHPGDNVGGPVWDIELLTSDLDPRWIGFFLDVSHAYAEGAAGAGNAALSLALARLKMVAAKDHNWEKAGRSWKRRTCPLGEGLVDLPRVFSAIHSSGFTGPISLQVEYEAPDIQAAITRDASFVLDLVARTWV
jgi:sugar phosphate isomerase/epimerase